MCSASGKCTSDPSSTLPIPKQLIGKENPRRVGGVALHFRILVSEGRAANAHPNAAAAQTRHSPAISQKVERRDHLLANLTAVGARQPELGTPHGAHTER